MDIAKAYPEQLEYLMQLQRGGTHDQKLWAQNLLSIAEGFITWLLFSVLADILAILRRANLAMQRDRLHLQDVERATGKFHEELAQYAGYNGILEKSLGALVLRCQA